MAVQRVLLMYISVHSGHHRASLAVERALKTLQPTTDVLTINSFNYTNPILERIINRAYLEVIRRRPEVWEYLYDNPNVVRRTQALKRLIHRFNSAKLRDLLKSFRPDAIGCAQAFPCGMVADFKASHRLEVPLVAMLTDYAPHSYWLYDEVDWYVVPAPETRERLVRNGVAEERVQVFGIPIDQAFGQPTERNEVCRALRLDPAKPAVLIMGGSGGLGPVKELVWFLDRSSVDTQVLVVTGTNARLHRWLTRKSRWFRKAVRLFAYVEYVDQLMGCATLIVTKPGGLTTAEALAKGLPMVIVNPIPGQEANNAQFLLRHEVAVRARNPTDAVALIGSLLQHPTKLQQMQRAALRLGRPDAALRTARLLLGEPP